MCGKITLKIFLEKMKNLFNNIYYKNMSVKRKRVCFSEENINENIALLGLLELKTISEEDFKISDLVTSSKNNYYKWINGIIEYHGTSYNNLELKADHFKEELAKLIQYLKAYKNRIKNLEKMLDNKKKSESSIMKLIVMNSRILEILNVQINYFKLQIKNCSDEMDYLQSQSYKWYTYLKGIE